MAVQIIANVVYANGAVYKTPVTASWSGNIYGTGNIVVSSGSKSVTGDVGLLGNNYVIRTYTNTYVGTIKSKIGTTVTLYSPAATGIPVNTSDNATNYKYQSYSQSIITNELSPVGNGTISVYTTNSAVIGSGTTFKTQLDLGYQIFDNTDFKTPNLLGVIKSITSNTRAEFTTVSAVNATNIQYQFFNPTTKKTSNIFSPQNHVLNQSLIEWSRSGLIQNLSQVKSYHPPIPDPVTGIPVSFPASVYTTGFFANVANVSINHLDSATDSNFNQINGVVTAFNSEHGIVGSSLNKAIDSIPFNTALRKIVSDPTMTEEQFQIELKSLSNSILGNAAVAAIPGILVDTVPLGFTKADNYGTIDPPFIKYQGPSANVVYVVNYPVFSSMFNTPSDTLALLANQPPTGRIINSLQDAKDYFASADNADSLSDSQKADLAARAPEALQFTPDTAKKLVLTGAPACVPGQLNVILQDENPANRKYVVPKYYPSYYKELFGDGLYNPDLPPSPLNVPPPKEF
jgi:hypothetical protein